MIGYYVGFVGVLLVFAEYIQRRVPRLWIVSSDRPLSQSSPITPEQWTHKHSDTKFFKLL